MGAYDCFVAFKILYQPLCLIEVKDIVDKKYIKIQQEDNMKSVRFTVLFLFIFYVLGFVYSSTTSWAADEEYYHMGSMKMQKCRIISMIEKVNEYTNTLILYHKMYNDPGNERIERKTLNKLIGFIQKLQSGNSLHFYADVDKRQELTDPREIANYLLGLTKDQRTQKIKFDITEFKIHYVEGLDEKASEFAIDCVATVSFKYHLITKGNSSGTMDLEVAHMRVCISD